MNGFFGLVFVVWMLLVQLSLSLLSIWIVSQLLFIVPRIWAEEHQCGASWKEVLGLVEHRPWPVFILARVYFWRKFLGWSFKSHLWKLAPWIKWTRGRSYFHFSKSAYKQAKRKMELFFPNDRSRYLDWSWSTDGVVLLLQLVGIGMMVSLIVTGFGGRPWFTGLMMLANSLAAILTHMTIYRRQVYDHEGGD